MSGETIRCPNTGRRVMAILVLGLLSTILAGCPPRNPTPVAGPGVDWVPGEPAPCATRNGAACPAQTRRLDHSQSSRLLWPWLEGTRTKVRPWRQVSVRGAVADSSAVPVIREVQRANMPYGNSGVTPAHHGRHRMHAPFVSQGSASLQQRGRVCVERKPSPEWHRNEYPHNFLKNC
jgi:hypothetical protein